MHALLSLGAPQLDSIVPLTVLLQQRCCLTLAHTLVLSRLYAAASSASATTCTLACTHVVFA